MSQFEDLADRLLRRLSRVQIAILLFESLLLIVSFVLFWVVIRLIEQKYLVHMLIPAVLISAPVLVILLLRTFFLYRRTSTEIRIAARLDQKFDLKNRFATYVELRKQNHPFVPAIRTDLESQLAGINLRSATNFGSGLAASGILLIAVLLILAAIPYLPVPSSVTQKKEERRQIQKAAEKLEKDLQTLQKTSIKNPELHALLKSFEKSAKELQKPQVNKTEALKDLNALQQKLEKQRSGILNQSQKELSKSLGKMLKNQPANSAVPHLDPKEAAQLAEDLAGAIDPDDKSAQEIADALRSGRFSKADADKLRKSLEKYEEERGEAAKKLAELQEKLQNSKKGMVSGKGKVTYDSRVQDRDIQKSKGGVEDGPGTTNMDIGPHHFETKKQKEGGYMEDRTRANFEKLYKGQREKAGADPLFLNSQWDEEKAKFSRVRTFGLDSNAALTEESAMSSTQAEEESPISKENIPASYREMVKQYLDSIQH